MGDAAGRPDHGCLFGVAAGQHGHFTTAQAERCGFSRALLASHAGRGRFRRLRRGLYRYRDYPPSPWEAVATAWLAVGREVATVSHASALDLLGLGDVAPGVVHLTVPRSRRHLPRLAGVAIHTATMPPGPGEVVVREGIRVTAPLRTILDVAEAGGGADELEPVIWEAIARGMVGADRLGAGAAGRNARVVELVLDAVVPGRAGRRDGMAGDAAGMG
jgi:predicted transcriptional regulator of viral defense system